MGALRAILRYNHEITVIVKKGSLYEINRKSHEVFFYHLGSCGYNLLNFFGSCHIWIPHITIKHSKNLYMG